MITKACPVEPRCVSDLLASPQLSPVFFGLGAEDGQFQVDSDKFVCCEGTGSYFDAKINAVRCCDIRKRLARLSVLFRSMQAFWPECNDGGLEGLESALPQEAYGRFRAFLEDDRQAWAFRVDPYKGPSWLWAAAAAAIWRMGRSCQVLSFGSSHADVMPLSGKDSPDAILVEGVQTLSDPRKALRLEEIIGQAYNANTKLIIEFAYTPNIRPPDERSSFSTKGLFSKRVERLKNQDPLAFLEANTKSRLEFMCRTPIPL